MTARSRSSSTRVTHRTGMATHVSVAAHVATDTACLLLHHVLTSRRPYMPAGGLAALQQLWSSTYIFERLLATSRQWLPCAGVAEQRCCQHSQHGQRNYGLVVLYGHAG